MMWPLEFTATLRTSPKFCAMEYFSGFGTDAKGRAGRLGPSWANAGTDSRASRAIAGSCFMEPPNEPKVFLHPDIGTKRVWYILSNSNPSQNRFFHQEQKPMKHSWIR